MKPIVIYHKNCVDGFGAAWCFWRRYKDNLEYFGGEYGKPPPDVTGREVYLLDFSYKRAVLEEMLSKVTKLQIIDHHASAKIELEGLSHERFRAEFDMNRSGASMAWDYLFPEEQRPLLLNYIEDRDLWRFNLDKSREIASMLFSFPYDFEVWDDIMHMRSHSFLQLVSGGQAIERKHQKDLVELLPLLQRTMTIAEHSVPVANVPYIMASDAGMLMSVDQPFAATYYDTAEHRCFSLRSQKDYGEDVSKIAQLFGGGGHVNASAFKVPRYHELAYK